MWVVTQPFPSHEGEILCGGHTIHMYTLASGVRIGVRRTHWHHAYTLASGVHTGISSVQFGVRHTPM